MNHVHNNFLAVQLATVVMEGEDPKQFLRGRQRQLRVAEDPSHQGWYNIPVFYGDHMRVNFFRPWTTNPKEELKKRLQFLLRTRTGYRPGDTFVSPWARFEVDDRLGVTEI